MGGREMTNCYVALRNGVIDAITHHKPHHGTVLDLGELDLVPGVIDLHSDGLNTRRHPRPGTDFPMEAVLLHADTEAISNGVTTQCFCVTIDEDLAGSADLVDPLHWLGILEQHRLRLRTDSYLHARFELSSTLSALPQGLLNNRATLIASYMVHAPGVGQYAHDQAAWRERYLRLDPNTPTSKENLASERCARAADTFASRSRVADAALKAGITLASHDDVTPRDTIEAARVGASIAEFPLTMEAATHARSMGLGVVLGAPNAWQGRSHLAWLSARTAVSAGVVDALVSDYLPASMLEAAYCLVREGCTSWAGAMNLVTQGPARLVGLTDRGEIAEGLVADVAAVDLSTGTPVVRQVWRTGIPRLGLV
ncbi:alpha-D-ribose 1-methylphosphonate 5-triphosphate diphosphatase [Mycolicibacterium litorale]|nr:alpha-D-ribose 1-methylphosphonate 5-triphosphate diphosphatase [Mycolicibacterium litorale]